MKFRHLKINNPLLQLAVSYSDHPKVKNPDEPKDVVKNWLRSRSTLDFLGLWEQINNPSFKGVEFDSFKNLAGTNSFTLSPSKWIETTGAIGIRSTAGRTGGTYAHQDIAFEFASWVSAEFKLYLIKEFQRLKDEEIQAKSLEWNLTRSLSKLIILSNLESLNAELIRQGIAQSERLVALNSTAIHQMRSLLGNSALLRIK